MRLPYLMERPTARRRLTYGDDDTRLLVQHGALMYAQLAGCMGHWFDEPLGLGGPFDGESCG